MDQQDILFSKHWIVWHHDSKVDGPNSSLAIIWTSMFESYVVMDGSKNMHQKDTFVKEIELHVQNLLTDSCSIVKMSGGGGTNMTT